MVNYTIVIKLLLKKSGFYIICNIHSVHGEIGLTFYRNQTTGGWSNEGIIQDDDPRSPVMCNSTHLTTFAVLVSAEGGDDFVVSNCLIMQIKVMSGREN